jgi:hypothetical protein
MMNYRAKFCAASLLLLLSALLPQPSLAAAAAQADPHWNKNTCQTCHVDAAPVAGDIRLQETDAEALCESCHGDRGDARPCRHISDIAPGDPTLPDSYAAKLKDGQVVCTTCHDVTYQCLRPNKSYSFMNPGFVRDRVSQDPGTQCYQCHDDAGYQKLNPHGGSVGDPPKPTCPLCHTGIPETSNTGQLAVDFNMQHDLNDMCRGCHAVPPHPRSMAFSTQAEGWVHLVVPSAEILGNMQKTESETGIALPLNPLNNEVFCATCHNPHDFKLGGEHGSQERAAKYRLRVKNICQACHDK